MNTIVLLLITITNLSTDNRIAIISFIIAGIAVPFIIYTLQSSRKRKDNIENEKKEITTQYAQLLDDDVEFSNSINEFMRNMDNGDIALEEKSFLDAHSQYINFYNKVESYCRFLNSISKKNKVFLSTQEEIINDLIKLASLQVGYYKEMQKNFKHLFKEDLPNLSGDEYKSINEFVNKYSKDFTIRNQRKNSDL